MNVGLYWCKNIFESDWNDFGEHSCRIHEFLQHFFSREISPMLFLVELKWNRFAWRIPIDLKWTSEFKMAASMIAVGNSISPTASDAGGCVVLAPQNFCSSVFLCVFLVFFWQLDYSLTFLNFFFTVLNLYSEVSPGFCCLLVLQFKFHLMINVNPVYLFSGIASKLVCRFPYVVFRPECVLWSVWQNACHEVEAGQLRWPDPRFQPMVAFTQNLTAQGFTVFHQCPGRIHRQQE